MCGAGTELCVSFATHRHAKQCVEIFNLLLAQTKGLPGFRSCEEGPHKLGALGLDFIYSKKNEWMSEIEPFFLNEDCIRSDIHGCTHPHGEL